VEPDEHASVFATGLVEVATDSETVCGDGRHPTLAALELRHQRGHAARDPRALGSGSAENPSPDHQVDPPCGGAADRTVLDRQDDGDPGHPCLSAAPSRPVSRLPHGPDRSVLERAAHPPATPTLHQHAAGAIDSRGGPHVVRAATNTMSWARRASPGPRRWPQAATAPLPAAAESPASCLLVSGCRGAPTRADPWPTPSRG
jgi:hypothetical protein